MAVGGEYYYGGAPHAEVWNGKRWRLIATPASVNDQLSSVSCVTSTDCVALGFTQPTRGHSFSHLIAARWNGRNWLVMHPRYPAVRRLGLTFPARRQPAA